MSVETELVAFLIEAATDAADRIGPGSRAQQGELPEIVYVLISAPRRYTHDGAPWVTDRIQLDCWGETYLDAITLAAQVNAALSGFAGALTEGGVRVVSVIENELDHHEPTSGLFVRSLDVTFGFPA